MDVDSSLVAVPGFDAGEEAGCAEMSDGDVTRPGFGPGSGRISLWRFRGALEGPGFGRAELVKMPRKLAVRMQLESVMKMP